MPRDDLILFLDLETTGTDEAADNIIEVGAVMLDTETLEEKGTFSQVVLPNDAAFMRMMRKDVVRKMHEANGLLTELTFLMAAPSWHNDIRSVDLAMYKWVRSFTGDDTTHVPYGGSGVAHFDRRFIRRYLAAFDQTITHWAYDVGVLRRVFAKAGVPTLSIEGKTHRALDDARVHVEEFKYYQSKIRGER